MHSVYLINLVVCFHCDIVLYLIVTLHKFSDEQFCLCEVYSGFHKNYVSVCVIQQANFGDENESKGLRGFWVTIILIMSQLPLWYLATTWLLLLIMIQLYGKFYVVA